MEIQILDHNHDKYKVRQPAVTDKSWLQDYQYHYRSTACRASAVSSSPQAVELLARVAHQGSLNGTVTTPIWTRSPEDDKQRIRAWNESMYIAGSAMTNRFATRIGIEVLAHGRAVGLSAPASYGDPFHRKSFQQPNVPRHRDAATGRRLRRPAPAAGTRRGPRPRARDPPTAEAARR